MEISISPKMRKFVEQKVLDGQYKSVDEVIEAGLATLEQQELYGDFRPGELDQLIAEGEADVARGDVHDGDRVFRELDEMSAARRRERQA